MAPLQGSRVRTLFNGLDLKSVSDHLTLYQLYPQSEEGKKALAFAWKLLGGEESRELDPQWMEQLVQLIAAGTPNQCPVLDEKLLSEFDYLARDLPNRKLAGYTSTSENEVIALPSSEVDLARGMLLSQLGPDQLSHIRSIEALLDLMTLQILARVDSDSAEEKLAELSRFIFEEIGFRFPPHSEYAEAIDEYTFLPSVLDSRVGVCLGVSSLYLCLGQRLGLPLEIVTPPGHIYVRMGDRNIETTARGVHVYDEEYLSINTRHLQIRSMKEVIGLLHINDASVHWRNKRYDLAIAAYEKAKPYLPGDLLLTELLGYNKILAAEESGGRKLLESIASKTADHLVVNHSTAEDYLEGATDREALEVLFQRVDETRESLLEKKEALQKTLDRLPRFRSGWFQLATTWLQLHRPGEALTALERYHELDATDPTAEYYLSLLYLQSSNLPAAWRHYDRAAYLTAKRDHHPKALKELAHQLQRISPRNGGGS